jgi:signal peptidase II
MNKAGYLIFAVFIMALDQLSKWFTTEHLVRPLLEPGAQPMGLMAWYQNTPPRLDFVQSEVLPFFNIVMVWNKGMSFGMLNNLEEYGPIILTVLSFLISTWFVVWLFRTKIPVQAFAISLVIAGAMGNVIDRIRFGAVIDFLDFHIAGFHWPAFNIADSCIVIGVFVLIIYSILFEKPEQKRVDAG